ncbi:MAG TPA: FAD-binding protein [Streptosporangiaceae bacterium]|nr:FAD-binding protein [Streptosporangiaceae bacterium]
MADAAGRAERPATRVPERWDVEADVVVIGFGAAGACAALAAAELGCDVVVLDRFCGGGATALSGGVVYAGGGTAQQQAAGVSDSVDAMFRYLSQEVGDAVSPATLRAFCEGSAGMLTWLEGHGVPFDASLCPDKTSYPTNRHYLYYSGSELSARDTAPPAPRGHRTHGPGTSGYLLFERLARAVASSGARVLPQTTAQRLVTDQAGRVAGAECSSLRGAPRWVRLAHRVLHRACAKPFLYVPKAGRVMHRPVAWLERRYSRPLLVAARGGVVLAAGGFVANRPMLREHAPGARGGLPLGTPGDDGSGITLGVAAGGATAHLGRVSVWRFLTPPPALVHGVLVDREGRRVCDESRYGAAIGAAVVGEHAGGAWLLIDQATLDEARRQVRGTTLWFQRLQAWYLLSFGRVSAPTLAGVAARAGVDAAGLAATLDAYNAAAAAGRPDPAGKPGELVRLLASPPYSLLDCSVRPRLANPAPVLTLGGLVVDEQTGQVRQADGSQIAGLYAAGRTAVGICSNSYVSGLSLADCVFSGRRAGQHAAASREPKGRSAAWTDERPPRAEGRGAVWTEEREASAASAGATREDSASKAPGGERD